MIDGYTTDDKHHHHSREVDLLQLQSTIASKDEDEGITRDKLEGILEGCLKEEVYRIKGFIKIKEEGICILNFAFGRWEIIPLTKRVKEGDRGLRLTVMLATGEGRQWQKEFSKAFTEQNVQVDYHPA